VRFQLKPGLRRVWREAGTLQIGLSQRRGTVLAGLTPADVPLLEQLREGVDAAVVEAAGTGPEDVRRRELMALLAGAGVLVGTGVGRPARDGLGPAAERLGPDAAVWSLVHADVGDGWELLAGRAARRVEISGAGRLGSTVATTLAAAGVGELTVGDPQRVTAADLAPAGAGRPDVGRPREEAVLDAVRRFGSRAERARPGAARTGPGNASERPVADDSDRPDLVVLIEHGAANATAAGRLVSLDQPHLSVVIREDDIVVGPLVRPGAGPCLRCLDLHRGDRDPAWPSVLAQVLRPSAGTLHPEETAVSTLAAGLVALQVLAHLDGTAEPATVGATLEIELPDGLIARRSWPAHPRCGCYWPPESPQVQPDRSTTHSRSTVEPDPHRFLADQHPDGGLPDARNRRLTRTMGL
jgi:bacteriocin biosynthesis cyclodehydratase domain-containing protein